MAGDGRADCTHDRRFKVPVLLATFTSLRWGEATALRRCDLDLESGHGQGPRRLRGTLDRRNAPRPPKSKADQRIVGIPDAIITALQNHLSVFVKDEPGALVFPGAMGGLLHGRLDGAY